ncbi:COX15/CtaA family protein [Vibrio fluvialis]|uniref:COX15/CtaA family protein n=1 Tax=Vibrio fluvialis TaxID=676 RepID=UPI000C22BBE1|nr:COX15/CtaA family protein [Vibrio fluvialis]EKO3490356.1 COX15/CtaA family protein [Vibrio fluvialis]EKO3505967.1 COX15/CtaA family protein [Vibrio fluvialis]EKO3561675.1 COX15/CtaA family protein [Vibrio fluvialis]ELI1837927.1 COX15/CtaA family protein [Vibrio fluvialis]ELO1773136.1 COX15/CtaA family protein [Vibrio fluvialis]
MSNQTHSLAISTPSVSWLNLVRLSLVLTLAVIALGAYTRLSDAGLGCPDWPGCYGHYTVPLSPSALQKAEFLYPHLDVEPHKAWPEMIHRYFAGTLGLVVFSITYLCLRYRPIPMTLPLMIAAIVVFQALLGMWTVTLKLLPLVVMGHLIGGFSLLSCLWLLYWRLKAVVSTSVSHALAPISLRLLAMISLGVVVIQIMLGGWTSSNYAALMCSSLPVCEGNWSQYLDFRTAFTPVHYGHDSYEFGVLDYGPRLTIHVAHRFGAMLTIAVLGLLALRLRALGYLRPAKMLLGALSVQVLLGMGNVLLSLPLTIAVLHNLGAALLLISVLKCNYLLWPQTLAVSQTRSVTHE